MNFIENETSEKLRGGYYTDSVIVEYLLRWVAQVRPKRLLEPSCGDGAFFRPLCNGAAIDSLSEIIACELEPKEAAKACKTLGSIQNVTSHMEVGDFLTWVLRRMESKPEFDAVVGNPPFVRYQYLSDEMQTRAQNIIRRFGLRFTKHTNAWVPFVVGALNRLKPGGRLAMVVPAELLHVLHADSVRTYLLQECSRVLVLDPEELWFEGALQGVVLLLAEKWVDKPGPPNLGMVAVTRVRGRDFLGGDPDEHFRTAAYVPGDSLPGKWMLALLTEHERSVLEGLAVTKGVKAFEDVADVQVGIVTGANSFFLVPDEVIESFDLGRYARPMFGRSDHVAGVIYDERSHTANKVRGVPTNFLWFNGTPRSKLGQGAARYIEEGEALGLHTRFKCRIREPWYSVPSVFAAPIGMLKRSHDYPRMVLNKMGALTTDTAYRIQTRGLDPSRLVFSSVNSLTALTAELEGRHYGGGVLELVPSEINRLLIPLPARGSNMIEALDGLCRSGAPPQEVFAHQDKHLLAPLGLEPSDIEKLHYAWWKLRDRRQRTKSEPEETEAEPSVEAQRGRSQRKRRTSPVATEQ